MDLLGELGGVLEVILLLLTLFVGPFTELSYIMKALENLYIVRTKDP